MSFRRPATDLITRKTSLLITFAFTIALEPAYAADRVPPGASICSGCHASAQAGDTSAPADLASLSPEQIAEALAGFRSGEREGTIMPRLAKGFSEAESVALAKALGRPEQ